MSELLEEHVPENYTARLAWLQSHHIGMWDTIKCCERQGSLDSAIRNEIPNDFSELLHRYPHIECILFNGGKAEQVFKKFIGFELLKGRHYYKMPSTSPIPGKNIQSFHEKVKSWSILKTYIE